ncbi:MAG: VanZ family protein [Bacteroidota bacterium]
MQSNSYVIRFYNILKERKVLLVYIPLVVYWIVIFIATSLPTVSMPRLFDTQDKLEHFFAYFILGVLLVLTLHFQNKYIALKQRPLFFSIIFLILYAAFDEIHQYFIPGRYADVLDWAADVLGGLAAVLFVKMFLHKVSVLHSTVE